MEGLVMKYFLSAITVAIGFLTTVCLAEEAPKIIRVGALGGGFGKSYTTGIFAVLQEQKSLEAEFKAEGIKIEWTLFTGGPALNEALANNSIDFSDYGDLPTIIGKSVGLKR